VQPVSLQTVLREAVDSVRSAAAMRDVRISVVAEHDTQVEGDAFLLRRAFSNLVENAVDFSPAGGVVRVQVASGGRDATVTVQDQGPGVPPYAQGKVFEKFYSLARPHSGKKSTGLGLSFVQQIAALHQGRVELVNAAEGGALATFSLPRLRSG
jgi:two-component system sensor histidine kinase CreC